MENIYRIKSGDLINIREKFTEFANELCPSSIDRLPETYDDVKTVLDIQNEVEEELLEESISLNNLAQPDDIPIFDVNLHEMYAKQGNKKTEIPKKALRLNCVRHKIAECSSKAVAAVPKKYNRYRYLEQKIENTVDTSDLKPLKDTLITVRIYEPFLYKRGVSGQRKPRLSQEFQVLGHQKLTELRDKIYCHCHFGPFKDISNDFESIKTPETEQSQPIVSNDDSGYFFITDTFYNDYRNSTTDYSTQIREWMGRQPDIGAVTVKSMEETKFEDLNVRVGYPQVYKHYVHCEHVITFTDIRLLAPDDSLKSTDYPLLRCISSSKMKHCMICGIIEATFVVRNSNEHILDPTFICRNCLVSFHYVDGKKVGSFQAFRYYGNRPIIHWKIKYVVINCICILFSYFQMVITCSVFRSLFHV